MGVLVHFKRHWEVKNTKRPSCCRAVTSDSRSNTASQYLPTICSVHIGCSMDQLQVFESTQVFRGCRSDSVCDINNNSGLQTVILLSKRLKKEGCKLLSTGETTAPHLQTLQWNCSPKLKAWSLGSCRSCLQNKTGSTCKQKAFIEPLRKR